MAAGRITPARLAALIRKPLSDADIKRLLGPAIKIWTYPTLGSLSDYRELFDVDGRCIVLYLTEDAFTGHWVCLWRSGDGVQFFDPYGFAPDDQLTFTEEKKRERLGQKYPILSELLAGTPVVFNIVDYQKDRSNVNTCGRHCVVRLLNKALDPDAYHAWMNAERERWRLDYDGVVTVLTAAEE